MIQIQIGLQTMTNHDLIVGEEYIFNAIKGPLRKICIDNVPEGGIYDGTRVKVHSISGGYRIWVRVVGQYPNPIPRTFKNYYWPPECFTRPEDYEPPKMPKIVKRNVLNHWPALGEK